MHFESKPNEVVRGEGDLFFDVGTGLKEKFSVVFLSFFLSFGLASEVPKLTHYGLV